MVLLAQSCPTLCDPIDCGPPGPLVHGKNTGVGWHFLLQGIFLIQGLNLCLLNWQADSLPLSHLESLIIIMTAFPGQPLSKYMLSWISFFIHWTVFAVEHQVPTWEWRKLSRAPMSSVMPSYFDRLCVFHSVPQWFFPANSAFLNGASSIALPVCHLQRKVSFGLQ